jgi:hypothetical protein
LVLVALLSIVAVASADTITCGGSKTVYAGAHVLLTATPSGSTAPELYDYTWTIDTDLEPHTHPATAVGSLQGNQIEFNVPACKVGGFEVTAYMKPTGAPTACARTCTFTLTCNELCCPTFNDVCIETPVTWTYACAGITLPAGLNYQWWVSKSSTAPVQGTPSTWGTQIAGVTTASWLPTTVQLSNDALFNAPTATIPTKQSYVTVVVKNADGDIVKFCPVLVNLYYYPDTIMDSTIT